MQRYKIYTTMNKENNLIEFDDSEAIRFILNILPAELRPRVSEDDVQYILDLICDYYEENNLIDDENVSEASIAEDDMLNSIWGTTKKEKIVNLDEDQVAAILDAEFEYGKSIGIYFEE